MFSAAGMSCSISGSGCRPTEKTNKPVNVWSHDRKVRKSCVVEDFTALKVKGCSRLGLQDKETVRVVLENDGTEVDDDDYFQMLEDFCTFLFLTDRQEWTPSSSVHSKTFSVMLQNPQRQDASSGNLSDATDGICTLTGDGRAEQLLEQLCAEGAYKQLLPWLLMRPVDLEEIVNADPRGLYSRYSQHVVDEIQEMSAKALNDYNSAHKAVELLNLYDQATHGKRP